MLLRHLIIAVMLASFAPVLPAMIPGKAEAAETVKKKKKRTVQKKNSEPGVKKNFSGPRPGEPNAGWTDDCLFHYNVYGRLPFYCDKNGRGFGRDR